MGNSTKLRPKISTNNTYSINTVSIIVSFCLVLLSLFGSPITSMLMCCCLYHIKMRRPNKQFIKLLLLLSFFQQLEYVQGMDNQNDCFISTSSSIHPSIDLPIISAIPSVIESSKVNLTIMKQDIALFMQNHYIPCNNQFPCVDLSDISQQFIRDVPHYQQYKSLVPSYIHEVCNSLFIQQINTINGTINDPIRIQYQPCLNPMVCVCLLGNIVQSFHHQWSSSKHGKYYPMVMICDLVKFIYHHYEVDNGNVISRSQINTNFLLHYPQWNHIKQKSMLLDNISISIAKLFPHCTKLNAGKANWLQRDIPESPSFTLQFRKCRFSSLCLCNDLFAGTLMRIYCFASCFVDTV